MFIFRGGEKYHFKAQEGTSKMTNKIKIVFWLLPKKSKALKLRRDKEF